jgi:hypothetical protein
MTAPPGGPYGPGPYGTNPYGQGPQWGPAPQGGPYPPPTGPYPYPPQGTPYPTGPYPQQPYPQGGQQFPPGGPPGPYAPGPPPNGPNSKLPWLIVAGLAVLGVVALVATLVVMFSGDDKKSPSAVPSSTTTTSGPTSTPKSAGQTATDCGANAGSGDAPKGDAIIAGKLSFPASAAPGWTPFSDDQDPNLIGGVGVSQDVPGASQWMMSAEVATTNFVSSMDVAAQASKLMQCVANGPGYANASPTLGPLKTSSTTVDGIKAARVDADVTIADPARGVKGDSVVIIAVDTKPVTIFMGSSPIGDAASAAIINRIVGTLKVAK